MMIKAFIFGKFLPFHKGHEAMIRFALENCDFLTILIACSDKENISQDIRKLWIEQTFDFWIKSQKQMEVVTFFYHEDKLPNTSVASKQVSAEWSKYFKELFPDYTIVITSEPYGDYVAEHMGITHLLYDIQRSVYPISATSIRNDWKYGWQFLPDSVKSYFEIKVVLLGTESVGKTTLAENLAQYYGAKWVPEIGRELIPNSQDFTFNDLQRVASYHAESIQTAFPHDSPLIFIDTDIHITESYAWYCFQRSLNATKEIYQKNKAQLYLYLTNEVAFYQDGTRLLEQHRNALDISHREILNSHQIKFFEISGNWNERFNQSKRLIDDYILKYWKFRNE